MYTAASFTKNFGWNKSYEKLHAAIRNGFCAGLTPTDRETWRERSKIADQYRELLPLNFFLYSRPGLKDDFVLVDRLVERSFDNYDIDFAKLGLFAFHLASSGSWRRSKWPDGRVAGWSNELIRTRVWNHGKWRSEALTERSLDAFLKSQLDGEEVTKIKVRNNYRFMLKSAGMLVDAQSGPGQRDIPWWIAATQLFWDRQIFGGELHRSSGVKEFEAAFFRHDIHKLLGCTSEQGRAIALATYRDYSAQLLPNRIRQLERLRGLLAA